MKALTICQPYAELIMRGEKPIENRTWSTSYRGPLAIHAGKSRQMVGLFNERFYPGLAFGAIVGTVDLVACFRVGQLPGDLAGDKHAIGPWCWVLGDVGRFAEPVPCGGKQGLWEWTR